LTYGCNFTPAHRLPRRCLIAIGVFDGVHLGHQTILKEMVDEGSRLRIETAALTFEPHPLEVLFPGRGPGRLMSLDERGQLIRSLGVGHVVVLRFDHELAGMTPGEFVKDSLLSICQPERVYVGFNFTFGRSGRGTAGTLAELGARHGFGVRIVPPVIAGGMTVSSTAIRDLVACGRVDAAEELLGRPFRLSGVVGRGDGFGRELGYPTANVVPDRELIVPGQGVYAATAAVCEEAHPAVINVGVRPTLGGGALRIEAHLIGYTGSLYGARMGILFAGRLRDERAFPDVGSLRRQIGIDIREAMRILNRRQDAVLQ